MALGRPPRETWTTEDEIDYLKRIGRHTEGVSRLKRERIKHVIKMLRLYIEAARLRHDWGAMDRDLIIATAHMLLRRLSLKELV